MQYSHQYWMAEVIKLAKEFKNEVPVSALIVKDNKLVSSSANQTESSQDPTAHAELIAIREASKALGNWRLNNCILYTTLEPCPMCTGAIINSRISKIVFGAYDVNAGACGSKVNLIKDLNKQDQIEVVGGILEPEAGKLLKQFFVAKR